MRFPSPRSIMTGQFLRRAIPTAVTLAVFGMSPARAAAQSALRASADVPSGGAEARLQNDSLAAHLLRTPRSKPAPSPPAAGLAHRHVSSMENRNP